MKKRFIQYTSLFIFAFAPAITFSQQDSLRKEVEVVKAYQPSISDAFKINDIPKIEDVKTEKPTFNYQITPQPVFQTFTTEPVQAAKMTGEPRTEVGKGLLKGGIGNYQTPYAELFYNTKSGKNSDFGLHFKHISSDGKIKLINEDKVDAPYSNNVAELYAKHYFSGSNLQTKLYFERNAHQYYGYAGEQIPDDQKEMIISNWQTKQAFSKGGFRLNLYSNESNRADTDYAFDLNYQYFGTKTGQTEHLAKIGTKLSHEFDSFKGLVDASITYLRTDSIFNNFSNSFDQKQQILIKASPAILLEEDNAYLKIGINLFTMLDDDADARLLITPNIRAEWSPIKSIINLYAGAKGQLQHNYYSAIAKENPFVDFYQDVENSEYQYTLFGGLNGKFSPKFNYRLQVDYSSIKNEHFYLNYNTYAPSIENPIFTTIKNVFDVEYDDLKQLTIGTELYYTASDLLNIHFKGNYYSYDLNTLETAWHKPDFDATLSIKVKPEGPLSFDADIIFIGDRSTKIITTRDSSTDYFVNKIAMDPIIDLSFGMEYQYSPKLSFWGRANNFAFQKYESWLGYAKQGFNLLIGASYSF